MDTTYLQKEIILETDRIKLIPMMLDHLGDLYAILEKEPDLLKYSPSVVESQDHMKSYIDSALSAKAKGLAYPFIILDKESDLIIGSSRYGNISAVNSRLEIGWTWIKKSFHGSGINTHMKYLMLEYAFETLNVCRVELKSDARNLQSRRAMEKIGAQYEGLLRSHTYMPGDQRRDTVYYSILDNEWLKVKIQLLARMKA